MKFLLNFDHPLEYDASNYDKLTTVRGIYFIFSSGITIPYPFRGSKLLYIGMSERRTNSISARLNDHYGGRSGNSGLTNYRKVDKLFFTYLNFEVIESFWKQSIEDFESFLLQNFVEKFGVYPICNNKTGFPDFTLNNQNIIDIDWDYFN